MSELVDLISDGQMDGRQSVGGQTTDVIDDKSKIVFL